MHVAKAQSAPAQTNQASDTDGNGALTRRPHPSWDHAGMGSWRQLRVLLRGKPLGEMMAG